MILNSLHTHLLRLRYPLLNLCSSLVPYSGYCLVLSLVATNLGCVTSSSWKRIDMKTGELRIFLGLDS